MHTGGDNAGVVGKDGSRAIPVVYIEVEEEDAGNGGITLCCACCDGEVVEYTPSCVERVCGGWWGGG